MFQTHSASKGIEISHERFFCEDGFSWAGINLRPFASKAIS